MEVIARLMIASVIAGAALPAYAGSAAPAPSPTPLGDSISLEFSPEFGAPNFTPYKDSYIKLGFSHNLGSGFAWGVAVQDTFAPTESMPPWLATLAEWNPISAVVQATRQLWGNGPAAGPDAAWPMQHPVTATVIWSIVLTAFFAPMAMRAFRRRSRD